jgi:hypothetical protein
MVRHQCLLAARPARTAIKAYSAPLRGAFFSRGGAKSGPGFSAATGTSETSIGSRQRQRGFPDWWIDQYCCDGLCNQRLRNWIPS